MGGYLIPDKEITGVNMRKALISAAVLLMLFAFASCSNGNGPDISEADASKNAVAYLNALDYGMILRDAFSPQDNGVSVTKATQSGVTVSFDDYSGNGLSISGDIESIRKGGLEFTFNASKALTGRSYTVKTTDGGLTFIHSGGSDHTFAFSAASASCFITFSTDESGIITGIQSAAASVSFDKAGTMESISVDSVDVSYDEIVNDVENPTEPPAPEPVTEIKVTSADTADESWYSESASTLYIRDAGDLLALVKTVNDGNSLSGKTVEFEMDFDISAISWTPIAEGSRDEEGATYFSGIIEGNGHTIIGLNSGDYTYTYTNSDSEPVTSFAYGFIALAEDVTVRNLNFSQVNINVDEGDSVGAAIGYVKGSLTAENVSVDAQSTISGNEAVAGVAGRAYAQAPDKTISFTDVFNDAEVTGSGTKTSGILSTISSGADSYSTVTFTDVANKGKINGASNGAGGIVGYYAKVMTGNFVSVSNSGEVSGPSVGTDSAGGLIAVISSSDGMVTTIDDGSNSGIISGGVSTGGIVGRIEGESFNLTIKNSVNSAEIKGKSDGTGQAGGIIGAIMGGLIDNCENTAAVSGYFAGGIAGTASDDAEIKNVKAGSAAVTAASGGYAGRYIGRTSTCAIDLGTCEGALTDVKQIGDMAHASTLTISSGTLQSTPHLSGAMYFFFELGEGAEWHNDLYLEKEGVTAGPFAGPKTYKFNTGVNSEAITEETT